MPYTIAMIIMRPSKASIFAFIARALVCLAVSFTLFSASAWSAISSGGDYQLDESAIDNGGGAYASGGGYLSKGSLAQVNLPDNAGGATGGVYSSQAGFYDPPHITYQSALATNFNSDSGEFSVTIPPASIDKEAFDITLNKDPLGKPLNVDPGIITSASDKMVFNEGGWSQLSLDSLVEVSIFDSQGYYMKPLSNRGLLTLRYKDADNDGILDGSNPPVRVDTLNTWVLDEVTNSWVRVPVAGVDKVQKTMSVYFSRPGVYALIGALDQSVSNVKAYPVPFRPYGPQAGTGQGQTGSDAQGITFENIPQSGKIELYTLDGRLVKSIVIPDNLVTQKLAWDVKNSAGQKAASGVYIWRVVSGSNAKTGKLMVIW